MEANIDNFYAKYPNSGGGVTSLNGQTGALTLVAGANITITPGAGTLTIAATGSSGANTALSNLTPTAINANLVFGAAVTGRLKTAGGATTTGLELGSGNSSAGLSGEARLFTGTAASGSSGVSGTVFINSGNATGDSGHVAIATGTSGLNRGKIYLTDGSEGTIGQVWTSTDVFGAGHWAAASGGSSTVELRVITAPEAAAEQLTLAATPTNANHTVLSPAGGGAQYYGDDFIVTGAVLSWAGLGLSGILAAGDRLTIQYN